MRIGIGITVPEISNLPGQSGGGAIPDPLVLSYSSSAFCANASDPTPTVTGNVGAGTYSSTAGLVFVSTSTGVVDISASTTSATPYVITYTDTNSATATFNLTLNALDDAGFSYSESSFPQNFPDPTPTITGVSGGTFSGTTGLVIDASTGVIDLDASTIASHTVTYNTTSSGSSVCPNTSTQTIDVVAALAQANNVYSMTFDGTNDFVDAGNITALNSQSAFSTSFWINPQDTLLTVPVVLAGGISSTNRFYIQLLNSTTIRYVSSGSSGNIVDVTVPLMLDGNWHHIATAHSGTSLNIYFDGVKINSTPLTITAVSTNMGDSFTIGAYFTRASNFLNSYVDEVGLFNTALTAQEVKKIYYATETGKTADLDDLTTPPVKWYRMGD